MKNSAKPLKSSTSDKYIITDMASEKVTEARENVRISEETENGFSIHRLTADTAVEGIWEAGSYITVTIGKPWLDADNRAETAAETVAKLLKELSAPFLSKRKAVLTVCLGNKNITADSVGPLCAEKLISTRHLRTERPDVWKALGEAELSALTPGVSGMTGIETCELTASAVEKIRPELVIAVDAISARNTERLGTSLQLSDTGIAPGSGVGNHRAALNEKTLGVPVIAIGVPTVAHAVTLLRDAAEDSDLRLREGELDAFLESSRDLFITPRDVDAAVKTQADIIARAVNLAFLGFSKL